MNVLNALQIVNYVELEQMMKLILLIHSFLIKIYFIFQINVYRVLMKILIFIMNT